MRKIVTKDKKKRKNIKQIELNYFVLKQIAVNSNFSKMLKWNIFSQLTLKMKKNSKTQLSRRCIKTVNRKSFHKFSNFSRVFFLRLAKIGQISGLRKSSW